MNKVEKQQTNIDELLRLTKENPDLEIVPMVDNDVCAGDDFATWMGGWGKAYTEEIYHSDERIYFRSYDEDTVGEEIYDKLEMDNPYAAPEVLREMTEIEEKKVPWQKVIVVNITLP